MYDSFLVCLVECGTTCLPYHWTVRNKPCSRLELAVNREKDKEQRGSEVHKSGHWGWRAKKGNECERGEKIECVNVSTCNWEVLVGSHSSSRPGGTSLGCTATPPLQGHSSTSGQSERSKAASSRHTLLCKLSPPAMYIRMKIDC